MKITLDLKTILGLAAILGMIVGATVTIYTTFETKENHEKLEARFNQHMHYHLNLNRGVPPVFDGPIAPIREEESDEPE